VKTCLRCKSAPRAEGRRLCDPCSLICPKCKSRPRASSAVWCLECLRPEFVKRRKRIGPKWYKNLTQEQKEKRRRRASVWSRISRGKLIPKPCEVCGNPKTEAHHHKGYDAINTLDIRWLCKLHHAALERWERKHLTKDGVRIKSPTVVAAISPL